jgi:tartrate-resistant acid phosphatase type 5
MDHFILLGDMGTGTNDQIVVAEKIHEKINEINKKGIFVCGLGDNIYEGGATSVNDNQLITKFEKPYEKISDDVKFYMCLGNHDYGYNLDLTNNSQHQVDYGIQSQKEGKKWVMPSKYYTFQKKNIQFFIMDTNFEFMDDKEIKEQFDYLVKGINKSKKPWKILIGHHTLRSVGGHGNAEQGGKMENFFQGLFKKCKIHLYICGHDHNKQVIETSIGGKNTTLVVCGTGGKKYHDVTNLKNVKEGELQFASSNLGYGLCECSKKLLKIKFYDGQNTQEYVYKLNKSS